MLPTKISTKIKLKALNNAEVISCCAILLCSSVMVPEIVCARYC